MWNSQVVRSCSRRQSVPHPARETTSTDGYPTIVLFPTNGGGEQREGGAVHAEQKVPIFLLQIFLKMCQGLSAN